MTGATALLSLVAMIFGGMFVMFLAKWIGQGVSYVQRRRRVSQPRVVCRLRVGR